MVAEHVLQRRDRSRELPHRLAERRRDGLRRVAASLRPDACRVQLLVERNVGEGVDGPLELAPGPARERGKDLDRVCVGFREERRGTRRVDESVEQMSIPVRAHRDEQLDPLVFPAVHQPSQQVLTDATVRVAELLHLRLQQLEEHLGVADRAELGAEPLQLRPQRLVPLGNEE
jgi:hypothetical protein